MQSKNKQLLIVIPSVPVWVDNENLIFDRKFYDGMILFVKYWIGSLQCIVSITKSSMPDFGLIIKKEIELPFQCIFLNEKEKVAINHIENAAIILASGDSFNQLHISKLCNKLNIKCVYSIENILKTRYQIVSLSTTKLIIKLRRYLYLWRQEKRRLNAFSLADGLQMNGLPAFEEYEEFKNKLLYYDTRVNKDLIIKDEELKSRNAYLLQDKPLRLAFSGRLIAIKGVDHLLELALLLRKKKIKFQFKIYGTGKMEDEMKDFIDKNELNNVVNMVGSVDFKEVLIPSLKEEIDLFVCLHRQSDPSCTYLETLSCGIPIVGYTNKAFSGLLEQSDIGWGAKMNDITKIAGIIDGLNSNRQEIIEKSNKSVKFAQPNDFDTTFKNRVNHLINTL